MASMRFILIVMASALTVGDAGAAGLVQTLPEECVGAIFDLKTAGTMAVDGKESPVTSKGTIRIAVVEAQDVAGLKCRWVEIEDRQDVSVGDDRITQFKWWKFLIPERELIGSHMGVQKVLRIYATSDSNAVEPRLVTGKEDRRVVLRQIGTYFPRSPSDANRINAVESSKVAMTPAGEFECDCHVFDTHTDIYLLGPSRMQESAIYRIWTNEKCPTGVAAMEIQSAAQQVTAPAGGFAEDDYRLQTATVNTVTQLKLQGVERNFVSKFPDHH